MELVIHILTEIHSWDSWKRCIFKMQYAKANVKCWWLESMSKVWKAQRHFHSAVQQFQGLLSTEWALMYPGINEIQKLTAVNKASLKIKIHRVTCIQNWAPLAGSPLQTHPILFMFSRKICVNFAFYINNIFLVIRCTGTNDLKCLHPQTVL